MRTHIVAMTPPLAALNFAPADPGASDTPHEALSVVAVSQSSFLIVPVAAMGCASLHPAVVCSV